MKVEATLKDRGATTADGKAIDGKGALELARMNALAADLAAMQQKAAEGEGMMVWGEYCTESCLLETLTSKRTETKWGVG